MTHVQAAPAASRNGPLVNAAKCFRNAGMPQREQEVTTQLALHAAASNRAALAATAMTSSKQYMHTDKVIVPYLQASTECLKAGFIEAAARCMRTAGQHDWCGKLLKAYSAAQADSGSASTVQTDTAVALCTQAAMAFEEDGNVQAAADCYRSIGSCALAVQLLIARGSFDIALDFSRHHSAHHSGKCQISHHNIAVLCFNVCVVYSMYCCLDKCHGAALTAYSTATVTAADDMCRQA
jgi:hypothetical protein